ncbi:hypothetical protein [Planctomicrobium piriforme]|uniref:Quinol:cytochrome c oxidoreductase quinone-binding subunit 2 n=1 Tax=Planctomicrobium piriforme TaxID=1576369 RepID=A0A1I3JFA8_9PLAN|nr:hypothetical protein [Planctomicrobium piriforme]SFI58899.1 hypothetical protein SAMN05421753_110157 [Planctomicrobium piriforme]
MNESHYSETRQAPPRTGMYLGAAGAAGLLCAILAFASPQQFWPGYLVAVNFWMSISLGCLGIALIHAVTGGRWGYAIGRSLQAGIGALTVTFLLSWLTVIGAGYAFPWAASNRAELLNPNQMMYLDPLGVAIRYALFGASWIGLGFWLNKLYRREAADRTKFPPQRLAGVGIMVFFLTVSFAAIDFMMALSPSWASSIFPLIRMLNCAVSAMAVMILSRLIHTREPSHSQTALTHDLGNWLQAFNMLWTYLAFSQYILIWGADIPMEVEWYIARRTPLGMVTAISLFLFHFVVPFLLLLLRPLKKRTQTLSIVAAMLLFMCFVDIAWVSLPSYHGAGVMSGVAAVLSIVFIGGIWITAYSRQYAKLPDMIVEDPHAAHAHKAHAHDAVAAHPGETT